MLTELRIYRGRLTILPPNFRKVILTFSQAMGFFWPAEGEPFVPQGKESLEWEGRVAGSCPASTSSRSIPQAPPRHSLRCCPTSHRQLLSLHQPAVLTFLEPRKRKSPLRWNQFQLSHWRAPTGFLVVLSAPSREDPPVATAA